MYKARRAANIQGKLSEKQKKIIDKSYQKDPDRVANSESFKAFSEDLRLFGSKVFSPKE